MMSTQDSNEATLQIQRDWHLVSHDVEIHIDIIRYVLLIYLFFINNNTSFNKMVLFSVLTEPFCMNELQ